MKRQYCGRLGKIDNCQVGVYLGYANGNSRTLIDEGLYLPEDWANDPIRHLQCGVPDDVIFKTKAQLGLEMLLEGKEREFHLPGLEWTVFMENNRGFGMKSIAEE